MITIEELKSRAGLLLYRQLPEEYRFLDNQGEPGQEGELGDLEAYLHGFGHLLDLIRGTTEQVYADSFAEAPDIPVSEYGGDREIQTWLLPYLAELVGAELIAPDPERRVTELNNTVGWFKTKGTLQNIDNVADVVSGTETVLVEGWRRVLLTPRLDMPPFTSPKSAIGSGDPATSVAGFAKRRNVDLIVVGTRGLSKVKASSMGSVSRKLLGLTDVNCLVIR